MLNFIDLPCFHPTLFSFLFSKINEDAFGMHGKKSRKTVITSVIAACYNIIIPIVYCLRGLRYHHPSHFSTKMNIKMDHEHVHMYNNYTIYLHTMSLICSRMQSTMCVLCSSSSGENFSFIQACIKKQTTYWYKLYRYKCT